MTHAVELHVSVAFAWLHALPQVPQLFVSLGKFTQASPLRVAVPRHSRF
jgi:hypothetical protein